MAWVSFLAILLIYRVLYIYVTKGSALPAQRVSRAILVTETSLTEGVWKFIINWLTKFQISSAYIQDAWGEKQQAGCGNCGGVGLEGVLQQSGGEDEKIEEGANTWEEQGGKEGIRGRSG